MLLIVKCHVRSRIAISHHFKFKRTGSAVEYDSQGAAEVSMGPVTFKEAEIMADGSNSVSS
jgi:hypothetical protein